MVSLRLLGIRAKTIFLYITFFLLISYIKLKNTILCLFSYYEKQLILRATQEVGLRHLYFYSVFVFLRILKYIVKSQCHPGRIMKIFIQSNSSIYKKKFAIQYKIYVLQNFLLLVFL